MLLSPLRATPDVRLLLTTAFTMIGRVACGALLGTTTAAVARPHSHSPPQPSSQFPSSSTLSSSLPSSAVAPSTFQGSPWKGDMHPKIGFPDGCNLTIGGNCAPSYDDLDSAGVLWKCPTGADKAAWGKCEEGGKFVFCASFTSFSLYAI